MYLAFNAGQIFWQAMQSDHGDLIAASVRWAMGEDPPRVQAYGAGMIDLAVRAAEDEMAVTVVNLNNPMAMRGQIRSVLPLTDQRLVIRAPRQAGAAKVRLLVSGAEMSLPVECGQVQVGLDRIAVLEVVHVRWTQGWVGES